MEGRIMVVDDDHYILELLDALLSNEGYRVQSYESAEEALDAARSDPPDAAVIDLAMPGMNGLELIRALRSDQRTHEVPILVCSAYYADLANSALELQMEQVARLRKPFDIEVMLHTVDRMVHDSRERGGEKIAAAPRVASSAA